LTLRFGIAGLVSGVAYTAFVAAASRGHGDRLGAIGAFLMLVPPSVPFTIACAVAVRTRRAAERPSRVWLSALFGVLSSPLAFSLAGPIAGAWLAGLIVASMLGALMLLVALRFLAGGVDEKAVGGMFLCALALPVSLHLLFGGDRVREVLASTLLWPFAMASLGGLCLSRRQE
jgi:hypothetical protein